MLDRKSIYTLNKRDPDAIVYTDAEKRIIRLTREDFDTEADFLKWKAWSDENYHDEEKADHMEANHTAPLSEFSDKAGATEGPEVVIEQRFEKLAREQYNAETVIRVKGQLSEKQFRRLWLYCVEGMTEAAIAKKEKKTQQGISKSIAAAKKRLFKIFLSKQQ